MRRFFCSTVLTGGLCLALPAFVFALQATQPGAPAAPTTPVALPEGPLTATVTAVVNKVRFRTPPQTDWQIAKVGDMFAEGTEVQTLLGSKLQFKLPPDQIFAVDSLTRFKLERAVILAGKAVTRAGLKSGRVRYDIEAGGVEHDATIRSPNATLAVRGTQVTLYDQPPFTPQAISLTGTAQFRDARKTVPLGGKGHRAAIDTNTSTPAHLALNRSVVDPFVPRARTTSEATLVTQLVATGATAFFDPVRGIEVLRGGTPPSPQGLANILPGLNIILSWTGNANLNLSVGLQQANEFLYPVQGLSRYPNGDHIPFDYQGGPHGGTEVANFPRITNANNTTSLSPNFNELFTIGATHVSGKPANFTFSAFLNGKPTDVFDLSALQFVPTVSGTLGPHEQSAAEFAIGQQAIVLQLLSNPFPFGGPLPSGVLPSAVHRPAAMGTQSQVTAPAHRDLSVPPGLAGASGRPGLR